jgi:hypothetical protein
MPTEVLPIVPNRQALRALYDEAVKNINTRRLTIDLTTGFYAETGNAVFDACYLALSDSCKGVKGPRRVHVVCAPAGGGKTSFSYAFMVALTRHAENNPEAPYGCVFVVDQIKKADEAYRELNALMPGEVAVWTTEHDRGCKKRTKVPNPAAEFTKDELRLYPIIVVTHAFYNGAKGNKAHLVVHNGVFQNNRALIIVDERPEEVELFETTLKVAQDIREKLEAKRPELKEPLDALMRLMMPRTFIVNSTIQKPDGIKGIHADHLQWFNSKDAEFVAKSYATQIAGLHQLFGFARALILGCAFAAKSGHEPPPLKWSDLSYVFWHQGGPICRGRSTNRKMSSRSCGRLMCWSRKGSAWRTPSVRSV